VAELGTDGGKPAELPLHRQRRLRQARSAQGKAEAAATNNHGTYYDLLESTVAVYIGQSSLAKTVVNAAKKARGLQDVRRVQRPVPARVPVRWRPTTR
jgi:hypothetical protein